MKQFRKSLALLLSVLMLMTVMPLSGLVSAAADNLIVNGDFESGSASWVLTNDSDTATEVIDDPTGSGRGKVMHTVSTYNNSNGRDDMFYQQPTMEANTDYVLTFKVYCYSTASNAAFIVNFYDKDGGQKVTYNTPDVTGLGCQNIDSSSAVRCRLNVNSNTGKWVDLENRLRTWKGSGQDTLYVVTGSVLQTVGGNEVVERVGSYANSEKSSSIPNYFYKACLKLTTVNGKPNYKAIAILLPHTSTPVSDYLTDDEIMSIDALEEKLGLDFFVNLPDEIEEEIEAICSPNLWGL